MLLHYFTMFIKDSIIILYENSNFVLKKIKIGLIGHKMVAISKNSELYDQIFKNVSLPDTFKSRYPSYEEIVNGFLDPSTEAMRLRKEHLNGDQTGDIRNASQFLLKDLVLSTGSSAPINFPSMLLDGLFNVIQSADVDSSLTDYDVTDKIMTGVTSKDFNKTGGIAGVAIGAGLLTLSLTVPIIGMFASAIVGLATGISKKIRWEKEKIKLDQAENRALLYKTFAPLQVAGSASDSALVEEMRIIFRSHDWSDLYSPRFKGEWVGIERVGGFAFAPGSTQKDSSEFAADVNEKFKPSGGFGIIPGTDIVTSVIQVSLSHDPAEGLASQAFQKYMTKSGPNNSYGPDPRTFKNAWSLITDVGTYYPTTGRLGAAWWAIALQEGNWYKFRIDAKRLDKEWKEYCDAGLRFIRNKSYKWTQGNLNNDYEAYFGTAIYYAIGAWAGRVNGGTTTKPTYEKFAKPVGFNRNQMVAPNLYKNGLAINSSNSGAFLPLQAITDQKGNFYKNSWWCDSCLGSMYDRGYDIKSKLDDLKNRQKWDLYKSLASAYCSQFDAAFQADPKLLELLLSQRKLLLSHSDRKKINLLDVLDDEPGLQGIKNSSSWKQQLIDAGVPLVLPNSSKFNKFDMKISFGANIPPDLNPPGEVEIDPGPINPYDPNFKIKRVGRSTKSSSGSSTLPILIAGAGVASYFFLWK